MNLFGVFVIIYTIAVCNGQPVDDQSNSRLAKQMVQYRLQHYPSAPGYQTQVIDYPGTVYSGQNVAYASNPVVNAHNGQYQRYQQQQQQQQQPIQTIPNNNQYQTVRVASPIAIQTTTTNEPSTTTTATTTSARPIEEVSASIPAVRAPIHHRRIVRPQHQSTAANRFKLNGQDFTEDVNLHEAIVEPKPETEEQRLLREEQARNAHYSFGTSIDDGINDHSIHRQETRNGLALRGMYSYSDGFYHRTIHYQADENGYRVTKEEIEPIGDGPQFNPNGTADVSTQLHNKNLHYSITADDFVRDRKNKTAIAIGHERL